MHDNYKDFRDKLISKILKKQNSDGSWYIGDERLKNRPRLMHYWPKYKATLWTLIYLADLKAPKNDPDIQKGVKLVKDHFYIKKHTSFSIEADAFLPCLSGNIIYTHFYFNGKFDKIISGAIKVLNKYQRFDDGLYKTPATYPYFSNDRCYGKHSCYWGVTKLLKGLSFIPTTARTNESIDLMNKCIGYILLHQVCYSSHNKKSFLTKDINKLSFPNMWKSDFLEILWLLKRENVVDKRLNKSLKYLKSKITPEGYLYLEKPISNLATSTGKRSEPNIFITERGNEVLEYYKTKKDSA